MRDSSYLQAVNDHNSSTDTTFARTVYTKPQVNNKSVSTGQNF